MAVEKPIHTIAGPFDRKRLDLLKQTIEGEDRDSVVRFEGQELHVGFGRYLAEYVEMALGKRNTEGL